MYCIVYNKDFYIITNLYYIFLTDQEKYCCVSKKFIHLDEYCIHFCDVLYINIF